MAESHSGRNYCLDYVKGIACIFVVFTHCRFPGTMGIIANCVARFSVPYFFMVSGYFSYYKDGRKFPAGRKIKHISIIVIAATIFYILVGIAKILFLHSVFSVGFKDIVDFVLFNKMFFISDHLWFLYALLYLYILYAAVDKLKLQKIAYFSIPVLVIAGIVLNRGDYLIGISVPRTLYRNFLIEGFPMFMLGHLIRKYQEKIVSKFTNIQLILIISVSILLCLAERFAFGRDFRYCISSFPQAAAIFVFALKNGSMGSTRALTKLGVKYSLFVYVLHPFVWHTLEQGYSKVGIAKNTAALYLLPVLVVIVTIILSIIIDKVISLINNRRKGETNG